MTQSIDQQRRFARQFSTNVSALLEVVYSRLAADVAEYDRCGYADDAVLVEAAFDGTGITREQLRAAMGSVKVAFEALSGEHGANLFGAKA